MTIEETSWKPQWVNLPETEELSEFSRPLFYEAHGHIKTPVLDRQFDAVLSPDAIARRILDSQKYAYVTVDDEKVGFISYCIMNETLNIQHIYILPESRGKGVGTMVLEWFFSICCTEGYRILETQVNDHCGDAMHFFRKAGMEKAEDFGRYGFKMVRMRRKLRSADFLHMYYI